MKKLDVSFIKQKTIKHIFVKDIVRKNYVSSFVFLCVIVLGFLMLQTDGFSEITKTCTYVYNPINSLFNDGGSISFATKNLSEINNSNLKFITPIKCNNIENVNNELHFEIDSNIMIIAPEAGIVSKIGVLANGEKFIEIKHSKNVVTRLENVYIVGVVSGQVVNKGKDIAIAKVGSVVRFSLLEDGVKQPNISVVKNEIIWKSFQ